jgi:hypothetical protein
MKHHAEELASILRDKGPGENADRRRHHRTANDVRAGEGRLKVKTASRSCWRRARSSPPTRLRCSTAPPRWWTAPTT